MVQPKRVGHVVLNVKDVEASTQFYTEILGFQIAKQSDTAAFLTCGKIHHDLALFKAKQAFKVQGGIGLNHMALQVEDFEMLTKYYHVLKDKDIIDRTTDHGMTSSIYISCPACHVIELFCNNLKNPSVRLALMSDPSRENTELVFS